MRLTPGLQYVHTSLVWFRLPAPPAPLSGNETRMIVFGNWIGYQAFQTWIFYDWLRQSLASNCDPSADCLAPWAPSAATLFTPLFASLHLSFFSTQPHQPLLSRLSTPHLHRTLWDSRRLRIATRPLQYTMVASTFAPSWRQQRSVSASTRDCDPFTDSE